MAIPSSSTNPYPPRSASSSSYPKKPPAPPEFLEAARAAALRSGTGENRVVLDCYLRVWDERILSGSGKPKRDITCGFKNAEKQFVDFKLTLWEELALDTGPVLEELVDRQWSQVEVDLKSATLNTWTGRDSTEHKDVQIGKAWILLPEPDGRWAPTHEPLPEPVEEEYPPDDEIDDGVDPFLPEFDDETGEVVVGEEEEVDPNDL